jgi:hypothetical protein
MFGDGFCIFGQCGDLCAQVAFLLAAMLGDQARDAEPSAPVAAPACRHQHGHALSAMSPSVIVVCMPAPRRAARRRALMPVNGRAAHRAAHSRPATLVHR